MRPILSLLFAGGLAMGPSPAMAQPADLAALRQQLAAMQAEIERLTVQVEDLEAREVARTAPEPAPAPSPSPAPAPSRAPATPGVAWNGAPETSAAGGWSFKPRGRVQIDSAAIDAPDSIPGNSLGWSTELRRAYIGFDGTLPGGIGYRIEADLANSAVDLTDVYLTYKASPRLTLTLGQHKPFWGLDEMTSDLFTPFMERAAFNGAFGFERRLGVSGTYAGETVIVQLGAFADNVADLDDDTDNSFSLDGRIVFSPRLGNGRLHLAGSAHLRELNDAAATVRYRARPFAHTTDLRLVATPAFSAEGERSFGLELAYIRGPLHVTLEGHQLTARRAGLSDPTFRGGYAEIGVLLTPGDETAYRNGSFDRIRPARPVTEGGIGAIQLNARYDVLDLGDGAIVGGEQRMAGISAIWMPTDYVRFLLNYAHLWIEDAAVPAGVDDDYRIQALAARAQLDF